MLTTGYLVHGTEVAVVLGPYPLRLRNREEDGEDLETLQWSFESTSQPNILLWMKSLFCFLIFIYLDKKKAFIRLGTFDFKKVTSVSNQRVVNEIETLIDQIPPLII